MTKQSSPGTTQGDQDPWAAFGYLVAGVAFYGVLGWLLGLWLNVSFLIPVGIVVGMVFGMYMVFARYRFHEDDGPAMPPIHHDAPADRPGDRDDRGETK